MPLFAASRSRRREGPDGPRAHRRGRDQPRARRLLGDARVALLPVGTGLRGDGAVGMTRHLRRQGDRRRVRGSQRVRHPLRRRPRPLREIRRVGGADLGPGHPLPGGRPRGTLRLRPGSGHSDTARLRAKPACARRGVTPGYRRGGRCDTGCALDACSPAGMKSSPGPAASASSDRVRRTTFPAGWRRWTGRCVSSPNE